MYSPPSTSLPYVTTSFWLHASDLSLFKTRRRFHSEIQKTNSNVHLLASCLRVSTVTLIVTCSTVGGTHDQAKEGLALTPRSSVSWGATRGPPFFVFNLLLARRYAGYFTCCPELQQQRTYTLLAWLIWYPACQVLRIQVNVRRSQVDRERGGMIGVVRAAAPTRTLFARVKEYGNRISGIVSK